VTVVETPDLVSFRASSATMSPLARWRSSGGLDTDAIRTQAAGRVSHDVAYRTTTTGIELARIPIPCRVIAMCNWGTDSDWPTPEPAHRINQIYLEPILFARPRPRPHHDPESGCDEIRSDDLE